MRLALKIMIYYRHGSLTFNIPKEVKDLNDDKLNKLYDLANDYVGMNNWNRLRDHFIDLADGRRRSSAR